MAPGSRLRQFGWIVVLAVCAAAFLALNFRVRAVVSEVRLAEREIIRLEKDKIILETEFQARANQQQLANWNAIEFGYLAPNASQFLEGERQLAALGLPRGVGAPAPIRVASALDEPDDGFFPAMISPITGQITGQKLGRSGQSRDANARAGASKTAANDGQQGLSLAQRLASADTVSMPNYSGAGLDTGSDSAPGAIPGAIKDTGE